MQLNTKVQHLRHVLYRLKTRMVYDSRLGKYINKKLWHVDNSDKVSILYANDVEPFAGFDCSGISDSKIKSVYEPDTVRWSKQHEVIFQIDGEIYLEPDRSLGIMPGRRFLVETRLAPFPHIKPDLMHWMLQKNINKKFTFYEEVIHFDGVMSYNLYHFYNEALSSFLLLLNSGSVPKNLPVVVTEGIYNKPYFQFVIKLLQLDGLNWKVQKKGEWIKINRLYKASASSCHWKILYDKIASKISKNPHRRIFLNRTQRFQRTLKNFSEIEPLLKEYGFEVIYAENLSYAEQVQLFSETEYLIALNGAGTANFIYAEASKLKFVEIVADGLIMPLFFWMAKLLNIPYYNSILGTRLDVNHQYTIDKTRFSEILADMVNGAN